MHILWVSDSPSSPTGLGNITRFLCDRLARLGHDVSVVGWQNAGKPVRHRNYTVYPVGELAAEAELLLRYVQRLRPDVLVTCADTWRVSHVAHPAITEFRRAAGIPWVLYQPVDSDRGRRQGLPAHSVRVLRVADLPVVMSRHGRGVMRSAGVHARYIPVGVDTELFRPARDRASAKRALGYDGRFVVLCDARNQVRKLWPRALEVLRRFAEGKDDVLVHLHCDPYDPATLSEEYRYDLIADVKLLGLTDTVRFSGDMSIVRGLSVGQLAAVYRAADVHLLSAFAEGFGMPTLQAAASGVVPLAPAYAANRELVRGHGEAIRVQRFVRRESGFRCAFVDIRDAVARLERLYRDRRQLYAKSRAARRFALAYDWDRVAAEWHRLLQQELPRRSPSLRRHGRRPGHRVEPSDTEVRMPPPTVTVPVTLPASRLARGAPRVTGRVYLASAADLPVFRRLQRIFPGLTAWSSRRLPAIPVGSAACRLHLATSTLALDIAAADPRLPAAAARCSTPCIGSSRGRMQARLWPSLTMSASDVELATQLGRRMLADQCDAADVCRVARRNVRLNIGLSR